MADERSELERIRKVTRNQEDNRGLLAIPGGILSIVLGAKLLFANFDTSFVENPSLFDVTGNIIWDLITAVAHIGFLAIIPISFWYNRKVGRVIADKKKRSERLLFSLFITILIIGTLLIDYNYLAPFSALGLAMSLLWLFAIQYHPEYKHFLMLFFAIQISAVVAGPLVFSELKTDDLNYMRHLVGLSFFCSGLMVLLIGVITHNALMHTLGFGRTKIQN